MLEEIYEQPAAIGRTLKNEEENVERISNEFDLLQPHAIWVVGSGSSYYCGRIFSYIYEFLTKKRAVPSHSSEFAGDRKRIATKDDVVFVLSQSGETKDAIQATRAAGGITIAVTNTKGSTITELTDYALLSHAGEERSIPSTKTFTSMLAVLTLFAVDQSKSRLKDELLELPPLLEQTMRECEDKTKSIAKHFVRKDIVDIVGGGINYPVALEGALKLKEVAHMHAQGLPLGEYPHGHISLVEKGYPVILTCVGNEGKDPTIKLMSRLSSMRAYVPTISFDLQQSVELQQGAELQQGIDGTPLLTLPRIRQIFSPFLSVPIFQLIAYHSAVEKGLNPDKPKGLHKVVE